MAIVHETRDVRNFDEVALQGRGDIILEQGDAESVVIEADEAIMSHVKAEVEGRRLVLGLEHWWDHLLHPFDPLHFRVSAVTVNGLSISGSGSVKADALRSDELHLGVSGSGEMAIGPLAARSVSLGISGAGKMVISGEAERVEVRISGSGNVQTADLAAQSVDVRISGSGSVTVDAEQRLDVQISGSGSVKYRGQPQLSQHISGVGSVEQVA